MLKRIIGDKAENYALKYLKNQGLKLITKNYLTKLGEIDLIMFDKKILVFIEVRFRKNSSFGNSLDSVDYKKQQKIIKTAQLFLDESTQYDDFTCRFDVIAIDKQLKCENISWIKDAFE
jgi:putative endonuclease